MNDIKDVRSNPEKYRRGLGGRGMDPAEIDRLLDADKEARMAKTRLQNLESQANVITEFHALDKREMPPEVKERKFAELEKKFLALREEQLRLMAEEIEWLDRKIPEAEARVADCDRRLQDWAATTKHTSLVEEVCDEIREDCKGVGI